MTFRITTKINDGKSEAPPILVDAYEADDLLLTVKEELENEFGPKTIGLHVGGTLTIERVA